MKIKFRMKLSYWTQADIRKIFIGLTFFIRKFVRRRGPGIQCVCLSVHKELWTY